MHYSSVVLPMLVLWLSPPATSIKKVREITAQIENKDDIPYLIKSRVEAPAETPSFMATPPLFRLEGKQQNTVRLFSTGNVNAPNDRESIYYFNVMAIPPADDESQRQYYSTGGPPPHASGLSSKSTFRPFSKHWSQKLEWRKSGTKLTIKNPTPFSSISIVFRLVAKKWSRKSTRSLQWRPKKWH